MRKPKKYRQEIKNLSFTSETLEIAKNDVIEYSVAKNNDSHYSSLYKKTKRFFIIYISEIDLESSPLYQNDVFCYRFREPGIYTIYCHNYPRIRQTVVVSDGDGKSVSESRKSEAESLKSNTRINSFFMESEEMRSISLSQSNDIEYHDIGECLNLLKDGFSANCIKDKFSHLFEKTKYEDSKQIEETDTKSYQEFEFVDSSKYDLYKVHQLNKMSPNNLFYLLNRLKNECVEDTESVNNFEIFKSFDDLSLYAKKNYPKKRLTFNKRTKKCIADAFSTINDRFR